MDGVAERHDLRGEKKDRMEEKTKYRKTQEKKVGGGTDTREGKEDIGGKGTSDSNSKQQGEKEQEKKK